MEEAQEAYEKYAYSPAVLLNMIYQSIFSPCRPARIWAWEFLLLDFNFLFRQNREPGGQLFHDYLEQTGREMPPWKFPYPLKAVIQAPELEAKIGCY